MHSRPVIFTAIAAATIGAGSASRAQESEEPHHVRVSAAIEPRQVAPGGNASLLVTFTMEDGWHIYWRNPGESGAPTKITLDLPAGVSTAEVIWPAPQRMVLPGNVLDYVYEDQATFVVPLAVAPGANPGQKLRVGVKAEWFMCTEDTCIPGAGETEASIVIGAAPPAGASIRDASLPTPAAPAGLSTAWRDGRLALRVPGAASLTFFEDPAGPGKAMPRAVNPLRDGHASGDTLKIEFAPDSVRADSVVTGLLTVEQPGGARTHHEISIPAPGAAEKH